MSVRVLLSYASLCFLIPIPCIRRRCKYGVQMRFWVCNIRFWSSSSRSRILSFCVHHLVLVFVFCGVVLVLHSFCICPLFPSHHILGTMAKHGFTASRGFQSALEPFGVGQGRKHCAFTHPIYQINLHAHAYRICLRLLSLAARSDPLLRACRFGHLLRLAPLPA